jgi:RND superfamily putative drug exporter
MVWDRVAALVTGRLGILLDTFIVRTLVIPALFALIGDRIWWPTKVGAGETVETKHEGRHRE